MNFYDYQHYMIDIETLGVKPGSVITEIAIVQFDLRNGEIIKEKELLPDINEQQEAGMRTDWGTLVWHSMQNTGVFALRHEQDVIDVLRELNDFIGKNDDRFFIWSNSPNFDMVMLQEMFRRCHIKTEPIWRYKQLMDFRTVVFLRRLLRPEIDNKNIEVAHSALADCKSQIKDLVDNIDLIKQTN